MTLRTGGYMCPVKVGDVNPTKLEGYARRSWLWDKNQGHDLLGHRKLVMILHVRNGDSTGLIEFKIASSSSSVFGVKDLASMPKGMFKVLFQGTPHESAFKEIDGVEFLKVELPSGTKKPSIEVLCQSAEVNDIVHAYGNHMVLSTIHPQVGTLERASRLMSLATTMLKFKEEMENRGSIHMEISYLQNRITEMQRSLEYVESLIRSSNEKLASAQAVLERLGVAYYIDVR